jgi:hypothetical protein
MSSEVVLPSPFSMPQLLATLQRSRRMLDFEDSWDGEGSPGYAEATWDRASDLLKRITGEYTARNGAEPTPPKVQPGPDGSIDIHWRRKGRDLVVNVPCSPDEPPAYYGETEAGATTEGRLDSAASNHWLLAWLAQ